MVRKDIINTMNEVLKSHNFKRKNDRFYLNTDEIILVFDIQRSSYSNSYYINFGISDIEFDKDQKYPIDKAHPKSYECNINFRVLFKIRNKMTDLIDLDIVDNTTIIKNGLVKFIETEISPILACGFNNYVLNTKAPVGGGLREYYLSKQ